MARRAAAAAGPGDAAPAGDAPNWPELIAGMHAATLAQIDGLETANRRMLAELVERLAHPGGALADPGGDAGARDPLRPRGGATAPVRPRGLGKPFKGEPDELILWIFAVEEDFRALRRETDDEQVTYAISLLQDAALAWFYGLCKDRRRPATWEAFTEAARTQFLSAADQGRLRQQLFELRQTGDFAAYVAAFWRVYLRTDGLDAASAVYAFVQGLTVRARAEVIRGNPADVHAAVRLAQTWEDAQSRVTYTRPAPVAPGGFKPRWVPPTTSPAPSRNPAPPAIDAHAIQANPLTPRPKLTPELRAELSRLGACFKCRQVGHMAQDCPERRAGGDATVGNGSR